MKERMSVKELTEYCARSNLKKFIFATENQPWYNVADTCKVDCVFSTMAISEEPNTVCLHGKYGDMQFDRVKFAEVNENESVLGTVLRLFCGKDGSARGSMPYILVMR